MKNAEKWRPTKFVTSGDALIGSRDHNDLAVSSRHNARLMGAELTRVIPAHAGGRILDLGCGRVPLYALYREAATSVLCVDWPSSLHDHQHVDVFCDVGDRLPFRDACADTVISSDVLEHLPDPTVTFQEFARVLAPGGRLVLNTPFLYRVHEEPYDFLRHTRYSLERLVQVSGLEVVEIVAVGGILDVLADVLAKGLEAVPLAGTLFASAVQATASWFGSTRPGHRIRRSSSSAFPLGHVLVARKPGVAE